MKNSLLLIAILAAVVLVGLGLMTRPAASAGTLNVSLEAHATGLSGAVGLAHHDTNRLYVTEIDGRIRIIQPLGVLLATPYLNIDDRVLSAGEPGAGSEQGLPAVNRDCWGWPFIPTTRITAFSTSITRATAPPARTATWSSRASASPQTRMSPTPTAS